MSETLIHCDELVLHAPTECVFCDKYPKRQRARERAGVNFTGHHDPDKTLCPSEQRRPLATVNRWVGNVATTQEMLDQRDRAYAEMWGRLRTEGLIPPDSED